MCFFPMHLFNFSSLLQPDFLVVFSPNHREQRTWLPMNSRIIYTAVEQLMRNYHFLVSNCKHPAAKDKDGHCEIRCLSLDQPMLPGVGVWVRVRSPLLAMLGVETGPHLKKYCSNGKFLNVNDSSRTQGSWNNKLICLIWQQKP